MKRDLHSELLTNIEHPETYYCQVWKYRGDAGEMTVRLKSHPDEMVGKELFWTFPLVEYFQGPFYWQGADFRLASEEECLTLLLPLHPGLNRRQCQDLIEYGTYLLIFQDRISGLEVKILSGGVFPPLEHR